VIGPSTPLAEPPIPAEFEVERAWDVSGDIWIVWSALFSGNPKGARIAGLAQIDVDDHVVARGAPFYAGPSSQSFGGFRFFGGWDAANGWFWIEVSEAHQLLKVAKDGSVLDTIGYGGDPMYLLHWTELPSGRWAGLQGGWFCLFRPEDRAAASCTALADDTPGDATWSSQFLDSASKLWIAVSLGDRVLVRRFDDSLDTLGPEVWSTISVGQCGIAFPPE
jgi:hypothetical protein